MMMSVLSYNSQLLYTALVDTAASHLTESQITFTAGYYSKAEQLPHSALTVQCSVSCGKKFTWGGNLNRPIAH